jgi:hypothetical protein
MLQAAGINVYFANAVEPGECQLFSVDTSIRCACISGMVRASDPGAHCPVDSKGFCAQQIRCPPKQPPFAIPNSGAWLDFTRPTSMEANSGEDGKSITGDGTFNTAGFVCDKGIIQDGL